MTARSTVREAARDIPVRLSTDVLVCGGGAAGVPAAIAAARCGARVTIVETCGSLGGVNTASGVNGIGGWQHDVDGRCLIDGIPRELMQRLASAGAANAGHVDEAFRRRDRRPSYREGGLGCYWIRTNPPLVEIALDRIMEEEGVGVLLHAAAVAPILEEESVRGVYLESKSGREAILAKAVIDCTGDGDIAARAGAAFAMGRPEDGACQPMSMIFTAAGYTGGVRLSYAEDADESAFPEMERGRYRKAVAEARRLGEIVHNPNDIFCASTPLDPSDDSVQSVNFTRVQKLDATDVADLTRAEILGRKQALESLAFMRKYIAVSRDVFLVAIPPHIGVRESRRIAGEYTLTADDVRSGARFDDAIMRGIYLIDTHNPTQVGVPSVLELLDAPYDIPYRCLLPRGLDGLLVAGRCISGDAVALSSYRVMSHCMALGQAAGTAAALSAAAGLSPRRLDPQRLRARLAEAGANIGPERTRA